ncbi:hypothetical protein D3C71_1845970 [compost metagenome]
MAAAIEHCQFLFVGIDVFLLSFGMGALHCEHALQILERGKRAAGVLGLTVELFVGDGFQRLGYIRTRLEHLRALEAYHGQGQYQQQRPQP